MNRINANVVLLVVGVGLLLASLLADVIGIGDHAGFGKQQIMGTVVGVLLTVIGVYFVTRKSGNSD